jgi:hypothetical protein
MGIEGVEYLSGHDPEEFHVVVVGRAGHHSGTSIYLVGPGPKRQAIRTGEDNYRRENRLAPNIALVSRVVMSTTDAAKGQEFINLMIQKMEEMTGTVEHHNVFEENNGAS